MSKLFGVVGIVVGAFAALGIWFPRFRGHWKGTRMACGAVSCAGFALFFLSLGTAFLCAEAVPEKHRIWFVFPVLLAWIATAAGYALDARVCSRNSLLSPMPQQPSPRMPDEKRGWMFAAIGVVLLVMTLWLFVLHR